MSILVLLQCPGKNSIYVSEVSLCRGYLHIFGHNELVSEYSCIRLESESVFWNVYMKSLIARQ